MQFAGSLAFTAFLFVWTFCYAIFFVLASSLLPFRGRFELARVWSRVLLWVLARTCGLRYVVEGAGNLPAGNHVALIKHSSSWETIAQSLLLPPQVWVLKRELTWIPVVGWGIRLLRAIAVNRRDPSGGALNSVLMQGKERLAEGLWVVVFPEGTRMAPGTTRRYGAGGAALAAQNGRFIVPIAHDAGWYWPRRGLYKRRGTIRVQIGPPIATAGREAREINAEAQAWIEAHSGPPPEPGGRAGAR